MEIQQGPAWGLALLPANHSISEELRTLPEPNSVSYVYNGSITITRGLQ